MAFSVQKSSSFFSLKETHDQETASDKNCSQKSQKGTVTTSFLQPGVNLPKIDHRISDFSDSKFIVQIISKETLKQSSAGCLTRLWKKYFQFRLDKNRTTTLYTTHYCVLDLSKIFNTDLKGLLGAAGSGDKQEFLSFNLLELRVKPVVNQRSMNSTAKVQL